jgi:hypothetical protein
MQTLPNEGTINLQAIRILEYGNYFIKNHSIETHSLENIHQETNSNNIEVNFDYDTTLRFTKTRNLDEMMFAFKKK